MTVCQHAVEFCCSVQIMQLRLSFRSNEGKSIMQCDNVVKRLLDRVMHTHFWQCIQTLFFVYWNTYVCQLKNKIQFTLTLSKWLWASGNEDRHIFIFCHLFQMSRMKEQKKGSPRLKYGIWLRNNMKKVKTVGENKAIYVPISNRKKVHKYKFRVLRHGRINCFHSALYVFISGRTQEKIRCHSMRMPSKLDLVDWKKGHGQLAIVHVII